MERQDPLRNFRYRLGIDQAQPAVDGAQAERPEQVRQHYPRVGHHRVDGAGRLASADR